MKKKILWINTKANHISIHYIGFKKDFTIDELCCMGDVWGRQICLIVSILERYSNKQKTSNYQIVTTDWHYSTVVTCTGIAIRNLNYLSSSFSLLNIFVSFKEEVVTSTTTAIQNQDIRFLCHFVKKKRIKSRK